MDPLGENAVRLCFGTTISLNTHKRIRSFCALLQENKPKAVVEWVPAYTSVTVYYEPRDSTYHDICLVLGLLYEKANITSHSSVRLVTIPVCYGGEFGEDLQTVANHNGLSIQQVIEYHSSRLYVVFMLGFSPGFPYLGGMDERIATPRLASPRLKVAKGSVGIAGQQTGIYSLSTPGGWQIIGRTPLSLFDINNERPVLLEAGDIVQFRSITSEEYETIYSSIQTNTYKLEIRVVEEDDDVITSRLKL